MLLQRGKDIIKWNSVNPLKCGAMIMKQRSIYYKNARFITKWDRYYKLGQELLQSGAGYLLQSGSIVIVTLYTYQVGRLYCKVGQLLQKRPVHLRDTRANGNPYLPTGSMWFENGILRTFNFRKTFNKAISFNVCFQEAKIC